MSADIVVIALLVDAHRVLCAENTLVSMPAEASTVFIKRPIVYDVTALYGFTKDTKSLVVLLRFSVAFK